MNALDYFPDGYTPRPQQVVAIKEIDALFDAGKRVVVLQAPTGAGKSLVNHTFARQARANGEKTHVLTAQKILQDQLEHDFPPPELELIKGRNAYPCNHNSRKDGDACDKAPCTREG